MRDAAPRATPARIRPVRLGAQAVNVERRADATLTLRAPQPLGPYPNKLTERLEHWARTTPDRVFMAQRDGDKWRSITYAQALTSARAIGEALLKRNLSPERPIVILSGNDIEHALLGLAAIYVGVPYAPLSPAYSLVSQDFARLRAIFDLITPGLVFAADRKTFARAIDTIVPHDVDVIVAHNPSGRMKHFSDLHATPTAAVDAAHAAVGPDTIAKFLFTSGSTGIPKCVINTQRMWCANQAMLQHVLAYFVDEPPVVVDWAPWHHTAGGNHDVGLVLTNGGTFHIDEGKPLPGAIEETVRNLREVAPTWYFNVPKGYEALLPHLRADAELRRTFFSRVKALWFAGAGIAQHVFDEMNDLAVETCGERIQFLTGFGATETAPCALARTWATDNAANMGLPVPGMELKLVPFEGKLEARVRGPNITPGYWRQPEFTAAAFDEEGFYRLGDTFRFADPNDPRQGLLFDGRMAEDFKLSSGTWVNVAPLRSQFIDAFKPYVRDVVFAGLDRDYIAALVFPDVAACRTLLHRAPDTPAEQIVQHYDVQQHFMKLLAAMAKASTGSSNRIARMILLTEPPSMDTGEMTDKGSINQRAVLQNRAALVEELYSDEISSRVIRA